MILAIIALFEFRIILREQSLAGALLPVYFDNCAAGDEGVLKQKQNQTQKFCSLIYWRQGKSLL